MILYMCVVEKWLFLSSLDFKGPDPLFLAVGLMQIIAVNWEHAGVRLLTSR